jgi:hypothetical protein
MKIPRTPEDRVSLVANGGTINGSYELPPGEALDAFREDLKDLVQRASADAWLAACRALNWRTAQIRALGHEPVTLPPDAPHYPPDDYVFAASDAALNRVRDALNGVVSCGCCDEELAAVHTLLASLRELCHD